MCAITVALEKGCTPTNVIFFGILYPVIIIISLQKCWANADMGFGMLICSELFSSESCYRPRLGDLQNAKCVSYAESELLSQAVRTNESRPPALAAWHSGSNGQDIMRPGTAYIVKTFCFIRIVTWKEPWIGSSATLSLRRTVTSWSRWRITPTPTLFRRPSLKGLESRTDLEVSSCLRGCLSHCDCTLGSCLSSHHSEHSRGHHPAVSTDPIFSWMVQFATLHGHLTKSWTNSESCCLVVCVLI